MWVFIAIRVNFNYCQHKGVIEMKNEKFTFPPENADLAKYQRVRTVRPLVLTAVWTVVGVALLLYLLFGGVDLGTLDTTLNKLLLFAAFIGVGVYIIKPYRAFMYGDRVGVVGGKKHSLKHTGPTNVSNHRSSFTLKEVIDIEFIYEPDGTKEKVELAGDEITLATDYYYTGDAVRRYRGFRYPYKVRGEDDKYKVCIVCGYLSPDEVDNCTKCGHSLLK